MEQKIEELKAGYGMMKDFCVWLSKNYSWVLWEGNDGWVHNSLKDDTLFMGHNIFTFDMLMDVYMTSKDAPISWA